MRSANLFREHIKINSDLEDTKKRPTRSPRWQVVITGCPRGINTGCSPSKDQHTLSLMPRLWRPRISEEEESAKRRLAAADEETHH
jgi:hypothetical protein